MQLLFGRNNSQKILINSLNRFHKYIQHFHLKSSTACIWTSEKLKLILAFHSGTLNEKKMSKGTRIKQPMRRGGKIGTCRSVSIRQSVKLQQQLSNPFSKCTRCAVQSGNYRGAPLAAVLWIVTRAKKQVNILSALKIISFAATLKSGNTSER